MAFIVRIRCHVAAKTALQGQPHRRRPGALWTDDEIRAIANRYADSQLSTLERDARIIACIGFRHSGVER
jgi:hypothetical protein